MSPDDAMDIIENRFPSYFRIGEVLYGKTSSSLPPGLKIELRYGTHMFDEDSADDFLEDLREYYDVDDYGVSLDPKLNSYLREFAVYQDMDVAEEVLGDFGDLRLETLFFELRATFKKESLTKNPFWIMSRLRYLGYTVSSYDIINELSAHDEYEDKLATSQRDYKPDYWYDDVYITFYR